MSLGMAPTVNDTGQVTQMLFGNVRAVSEEDSLIKACCHKTAEGIGMLSEREQVIGAYGDPSGTRSESVMEEMQYRQLGVIFNLQNGKAIHICLFCQ